MKKESSKENLEGPTRSLALEQKSRSSNEVSVVSKNYLVDAAEHLLTLMHKMKDMEVSPQNVNAACNVAQQIANIVKVNIEIKRLGL